MFKMFLFSLLLSGLAFTNGLYFFLDSLAPKCFYEILPKDTLVVGHWKAEEYNAQTNSYSENPDLKIRISVEEVFDNHHRVVNQARDDSGKFTFTTADSGDHKICFTPSRAAFGGFVMGGQHLGTVKMTLDIAVGETGKLESSDKGKMEDISQKVRELKSRLEDIRREQVFQREREAEFRDQSETVNSRVVKWTIIQLVVLGVACAWQLSHLRAFFIKQKLT